MAIWMEARLIPLTEEQSMDVGLAITTEEVLAEYGGLDGIVKGACKKYGGTYKKICLQQTVRNT